MKLNTLRLLNNKIVFKRGFHSSLNSLGIVKPFLLADIGEGIRECEIIQWFVKPGSTVQEFDRICEVQSDKASVEITSRYSGNIVKLHYGENEMAKVGYPLVDIETEEEMKEGIKEEKVLSAANTITKNSSTWEMPSVRRLLSEYKLKINDITGTGKHGRVIKGDVLDYVKSNSLQKVERKQEYITTESSPSSFAKTVPLTAIQKAMFKTMSKSLSIPQLGYKDEIELNQASEYRLELNRYISNHPHLFPFKKISYLPIFIKSLSLSLSFYPIMNAYFEQNHVSYRAHHNIGVAMDTPQGLMVPNIKNVEKKSVFEVATELHRLTELAKAGSLTPSDLKGGTITLSNIGAIGGMYANPVIVPNELAIVALGSARRLPRFDSNNEEKMVAKQILPVSWSADHRIIDGATIAQFGNMWKSFIENPALFASKLR
ncbi:2-oxoacid dehydrogenases acyltransferase-domain-containing protein [Cokeromyces recurvatus]|uniref:2-oxoacid dehydrogenases acyltransferase-domain-containing protein n=1 Tax=Cokeromyces recurvatus TaxID=90255 RepID=UPI00221E4547|nr:2-oxoacid dehydrogenases acyltransferase-domain-containing protein [Cokeromyces recurvatus]KAI7898840.1 2-oxoacid dehydrogenases acyltransferase-domain-containing protein [Cokeromyces recurvatus]